MYLLKLPSHDQLSSDGWVKTALPGCLLNAPSFGGSACRTTIQCGPSPSIPPSLSPLLFIGCLATRIKYRSTLSKVSILSIQSLSVFSLTFSLLFALLLLLLLLLPFANSPWRGLLGFQMKKWKTFLKQHKLLLSKAISTMSHLMTQWKSLLGGCVCTLILHRVQEAPTVHSFSLEHPLVQRAPALLWVNTAFDLPDWLWSVLRAPFQGLTMTVF